MFEIHARAVLLSHELSPAVLHHSGLPAALQWLSRQMGEQFGLEVTLEAEAARPLESTPLKVFLYRSVHELLFNVVKHSGVNRARVELSGSDSRLIIMVSDQGRGFDPTILEPSSEVLGFGLLGLHERARSVGGSLSIESAPRRGSRLTLTVPLTLVEPGGSPKLEPASEPRPSRTPVRATVASGGAGLRVLFVDDHRVMRQGLIGMIAGRPSIQVVGEASNGREAVELARELHPDVVVMDVSMPEMDGVEATRRIKEEHPEVRVIGLSMHDDEHIACSMRQAGAEAFVNKATSSSELLKAIYAQKR